MADAATHRAVEAVWRIESARLIGALTRLTGDVGAAEDLAQDALVAALEKWPASGVPEKPGAWLMATARNRALDQIRHSKLATEKHVELGRTLDESHGDVEAGLADALDDPVGDDVLRLVFITCHPVLSTDARVALTLRLVGGLTTPEIARAFLIPEATLAQRIVRAKKTLTAARVAFEMPGRSELEARLASVLEVIYFIFNEGYLATGGEDLIRPALCDDALRLGRVVAELAPDESEVHGLVAMMEFQASRLRARTAHTGEPVLLLDQNRSLWDQLLIHRGFAALARGEAASGRPGPYLLQASIAACHARAKTAAETDWPRIVGLYELLMLAAPSPVVALNHAVAAGMAFGPLTGLSAVDELVGEPSLAGYYLLPSMRGDFLAKLGRDDEARAEFLRAAEMTQNARERAMLLARAGSG